MSYCYVFISFCVFIFSGLIYKMHSAIISALS